MHKTKQEDNRTPTEQQQQYDRTTGQNNRGKQQGTVNDVHMRNKNW